MERIQTVKNISSESDKYRVSHVSHSSVNFVRSLDGDPGECFWWVVDGFSFGGMGTGKRIRQGTYNRGSLEIGVSDTVYFGW